MTFCFQYKEQTVPSAISIRMSDHRIQLVANWIQSEERMKINASQTHAIKTTH